MTMATRLAAGALCAGLLAVGVSKLKPHDEDALLADWSAPPPWPVFIGVNVLAAGLRAAADALTPPPIRILDTSVGYHITILMHIAQKHQIPDFLAAGPKTPAEIAAHMEMDPVVHTDRVQRLMYALAGHGFTKLQYGADKKPRFVNTALSAVLRRDHPNSMAGMVGHNVEDLWQTWGLMPTMYGKDASDKAPWDLAWPEHPLEKGGVWHMYEANPDREEQFGRAMTAVDSVGAAAMVEDGPFAKFDQFIDVGGSRGHFLYKLLTKYPTANGVLFDRPPVIANAKEVAQVTQSGLLSGKRLALSEGSFFEGETIPAPASGAKAVYYMRYILHDWNDKDSLTILKNLREAIGSSGASLLIGECAMPNRDAIAVPPVIYNIDMQMMAAFGDAKERTPVEWKQILAEAGFKLQAIHPTRSLVHWVEAVAQ